MKKVTFIFILVLISISVFSGSRVEILSKDGNQIILNNGSSDGITVDMTGSFWTHMESEGKTYSLKIGKFKVVKVENEICFVEVKNIADGYSKKDFQWATFDKTSKSEITENDEFSSDISKLLKIGLDNFKKNNLKEAEYYFNKVLKIDPSNSLAKKGLNKILEKEFDNLDEKKANQQPNSTEPKHSLKSENNSYSPKETLRSVYQILSKKDMKSMLKSLGFFDKNYNKTGDFHNDLSSKTINGDMVVVDRVTGLMWHPNGSSKNMQNKKVMEWLNDLNSRGYAGYSDWRLPTLEEGASLLESSKKNGKLYIDPVFSKNQIYIWTGDNHSKKRFWIVDFSYGCVSWNPYYNDLYYVRPVRWDR